MSFRGLTKYRRSVLVPSLVQARPACRSTTTRDADTSLRRQAAAPSIDFRALQGLTTDPPPQQQNSYDTEMPRVHLCNSPREHSLLSSAFESSWLTHPKVRQRVRYHPTQHPFIAFDAYNELLQYRVETEIKKAETSSQTEPTFNQSPTGL